MPPKCSNCEERISNCKCLDNKSDIDKAIEDMKKLVDMNADKDIIYDFSNVLKQLQEKKKLQKQIKELKEEADINYCYDCSLNCIKGHECKGYIYKAKITELINKLESEDK